VASVDQGADAERRLHEPRFGEDVEWSGQLGAHLSSGGASDCRRANYQRRHPGSVE
jgi:hypothetical protein